MTRVEAIKYLGWLRNETRIVEYREAIPMAIAALREQEERENVWHDAKYNHPKKPGLYYGKRDDTDSMYLCQYRDGVWTLDAYPETRMHVIKWAYYNAFVQEQEERRWIPVEERLPQNYISVLVYIPTAEPLPMVHEAYIGDDGEWHSSVFYGIENEDVTHWMPMPKTLKEDA